MLLVAERAVQVGIGVLVGALVARHLGVAAYGLLAYGLAFTVLLIPFWTTCHMFVVRDLTRGQLPEGVILGSAAAVYLVATATAVLAVSAVALTVPGIAPEGAVAPMLVLMAGVLARPSAAFDCWFQARLAARPAVIARVAAAVVAAALRVAAVLLDAPLIAFAALAALETALAAVALVVMYRRCGGEVRGLTLDRRYARSLVVESLPLFGSALAVVLYTRVDQVMLGAMSGPGDTGVYAVAVTVAEGLFFLPMIVHTVLLPGMTRLWHRDEGAYYERLQGIFTLVVGGSVAVGAAAAVVGYVAIPRLYGGDFRDAVPVFLVLLIGLPFVGLGTVQSIWSTHARRQGLGLVRTVLAAALNIALNLVLLPRYGARGAAVTTVVAYATAGCLANALLRPCWPVFRLQLAAFRLRGLRAALLAVRA